jgi:hypothetical protein
MSRGDRRPTHLNFSVETCDLFLVFLFRAVEGLLQLVNSVSDGFHLLKLDGQVAFKFPSTIVFCLKLAANLIQQLAETSAGRLLSRPGGSMRVVHDDFLV